MECLGYLCHLFSCCNLTEPTFIVLCQYLSCNITMLKLSLGHACMNNIKMYLREKLCEVVDQPGVLGFCEFIYDPFCL